MNLGFILRLASYFFSHPLFNDNYQKNQINSLKNYINLKTILKCQIN